MSVGATTGGYWYHTIALPNETGGFDLTPGEYDHRTYLREYGFPDDLSGKSVIDVGAADGFFSFELERRGAARVVALDYVAGYPGVPFHEVEQFGSGQFLGIERFMLAKERLGSSVEHRDGSIYELTPEQFGTFDLVFCGSVLLHLSDPLRAIEGLRRVCAGKLIVATAYYHEPLLGLYERLMRLGMRLGRRKTDLRFSALVRNEMSDTFWVPTRGALVAMVERAGFRDVRVHSTFRLDRRDGRRGWPHAVIHATV
jgi:tRNA (mo5U34)-methyltransferase